MKLKFIYAGIVGTAGMLLFTGNLLYAQLGSGSSSMGQGGPDITRPGKGEDAPQGGAGTTGNGAMKPNPESSGSVRPEGAIIMKPRPGEGPGRRPDSSATNPGIGAAGGSDFGTGPGSENAGSTGSTGSTEGGAGTGGRKGSSSENGADGK